MTRTCPVCLKPELRRHRHGKAKKALAYGRLVAEHERQMVRELVSAARARIDRAKESA